MEVTYISPEIKGHGYGSKQGDFEEPGIYIYIIYLYTCAYPVKGAISLKDLLQDYGVIDQRLGKGKDPALGGRCPVSPKDGSVGRSPGRFIRSYTTVDG